MNRFFVGQSVRIVKTINHHEMLGMEARIVSIGASARDASRGIIVTGLIRLDLIIPSTGDWACSYDHQLEPIIPEGSAPSEYSFSELMDSLRETVK